MLNSNKLNEFFMLDIFLLDIFNWKMIVDMHMKPSILPIVYITKR